MKKRVLISLFSFASVFCWGQHLSSLDSLKKEAVNVFLDCERCDADYFRQQITFVNYVWERKESEVHILITFQTNASGGKTFSFLFIGQKKFTGINDTLEYFAKADATDDEIRQGQLAVLKMGLIRYVSKTPFAKYIQIAVTSPSSNENVKDKWNSWIFNLDAGGYFNGEESSKNLNSWVSATASKITENWKIEFDLSSNYSESRFQVNDSVEIKGISTSKKFRHLMVKSINDHWSAGGYVQAKNSTFDNLNISCFILPCIEWNLFKYADATRKQLRFLYGTGYLFNDYIDTTIYNKVQEDLFIHRLAVGLELKQKWGAVSAELIGQNYLHDFSFHNVVLKKWLNVRLLKGFSVRLGGSVSLIRDQISLPKGNASLEDILLQQRQLATDYSFSGNVGLSYTFGSLYNNVVNPRFGN